MVTTAPEIRTRKADKPEIRTPQARNSDSVAERVRDALHALGGHHDLPWLARQAGIPASTFYDNLKNGITKTDVALKVAAALGVSTDWLLAGREPATGIRKAGIQTTNFDELIAPGDAAEQLGMKMIPEVDIAYSLGAGAVHDDYIESRMVPFRRDWLDRLTRGGPADVFLTRGQGDSMMPTILDDDVLVNRADSSIRQQDRIWALGYGELGMIKRVRRLPSGRFQLNSDNPAVTPIEAIDDELFVVGRVIWIGRRV